MIRNDDQLTKAEREMLERLGATAKIMQKLVNKQETNSAGNLDKDMELSNLRRQIIELKEENQHLKDLMRTLKERMSGLLNQIK